MGAFIHVPNHGTLELSPDPHEEGVLPADLGSVLMFISYTLSPVKDVENLA